MAGVFDLTLAVLMIVVPSTVRLPGVSGCAGLLYVFIAVGTAVSLAIAGLWLLIWPRSGATALSVVGVLAIGLLAWQVLDFLRYQPSQSLVPLLLFFVPGLIQLPLGLMLIRSERVTRGATRYG